MTANRLLGIVLAGALVTGPAYGGAPPQQGKPAGERDMTNPVALAEVSAGQVVARVNGQAITLADLQKPLIEGYGLKVLLFKAQLDLARQEAAKKKVTVTKADVEAELDRTMKAGFKDIEKADYAAALEQLLGRTGLSRGEFDMVIETNAILRKIAEPLLKDRITEENVREAYNARFGQTVQIRHIECANPQEALRAKNRIASGEKFEEVARTSSANLKTAPMGGELPVFSRQTAKWPGDLGAIPQGFRDWAFNAKEGDISDPIQGEGSFHILKLEKKIEPKVVKFEDQKEGLRAELYDRLMEQGVSTLRQQLAGLARTQMQIEDPVLRAQFEAKLAEQMKQQKSAAEARQDILNRAGGGATTQKAPGGATPPPPTGDSPFRGINQGTGTQGTPAGAEPPKAAPDAGSGGERPPASGSATGAADGPKK